MSGITVVLGIPVPSTDPIFLGLVAVHIAFGITAAVGGLVAMLSSKGLSRHSNFGTIYFWSLAGLTITMSALSIMRWPEDYHLFILGALSFGAAYFGRHSIRHQRVRLHLAGMGLSYVLMLIAFYVDNGKSLPIWNQLPTFAYWVAPSAIGLPTIAYYLVRLPRFKFARTQFGSGGATAVPRAKWDNRGS
jgi:hypothetical protein